MRKPLHRTAAGGWRKFPDRPTDDSPEAPIQQTDPVSLAKEVTKPIIDAIRRELAKVDVTRSKGQVISQGVPNNLRQE